MLTFIALSMIISGTIIEYTIMYFGNVFIMHFIYFPAIFLHETMHLIVGIFFGGKPVSFVPYSFNNPGGVVTHMFSGSWLGLRMAFTGAAPYIFIPLFCMYSIVKYGQILANFFSHYMAINIYYIFVAIIIAILSIGVAPSWKDLESAWLLLLIGTVVEYNLGIWFFFSKHDFINFIYILILGTILIVSFIFTLWILKNIFR